MHDSDRTEGDSASDRATQPASTGDERVDLAMTRLAGLDELPLAAQVTVFDDVHRLLQDALTGTDPAGSGTPDR